MRKPDRQPLVDVAVLELFRWILHETTGRPGVLPPIPRIAEKLGVSVGSIREALSRLRGLELVSKGSGDQLTIVPSTIAVSVDSLVLQWRSATESEFAAVASTWVSLKWLVARETWSALIGKSPGKLVHVSEALTELALLARHDERQDAISDQEIFALRCAAEVSGRPELIPLANSLVRARPGFAGIHDVTIDPSESRTFAAALAQALERVDGDGVRSLIDARRDEELRRVNRAWGQPTWMDDPAVIPGEHPSEDAFR